MEESTHKHKLSSHEKPRSTLSLLNILIVIISTGKKNKIQGNSRSWEAVSHTSCFQCSCFLLPSIIYAPTTLSLFLRCQYFLVNARHPQTQHLHARHPVFLRSVHAKAPTNFNLPPDETKRLAAWEQHPPAERFPRRKRTTKKQKTKS